ncbi:MAG: DNA mismatch repair endonuclease MutL [Desulfobacteraceae bacterium]|nr:DNA mismatch repair endonuclease MutL [Desulfobacteraceae bacterium]
MPKIRILPEILANKIAAGEVVERPASVVKELVENALDAQSTRITIDIEKGGRSLIRVADNGIGMSHDDALMALERFATSKIRSDADLFAIRTLGFRGEALPSLAAVSKMTLISRTQQADSGVQIKIEGGKILQVNEVGAPAGTLINVEQLFFNTPARRKFLKTINTEMAHIADMVSGMALGHCGVHFKLSHNGKKVKQWLRAKDLAQRAASVLGQVRREDLIDIQFQDDYLTLSGLVAVSQIVRSTSRGIYLYVNGRRVRDRVIQHALFEGYHGRLVKGQFPLAVLYIDLGYDQVDVNVHPAKHEIRFANQRRVHSTIRDAVARALENGERRLWSFNKTDYKTNYSSPKQAVAEPAAPYAVPDRFSNKAPMNPAADKNAVKPKTMLLRKQPEKVLSSQNPRQLFGAAAKDEPDGSQLRGRPTVAADERKTGAVAPIGTGTGTGNKVQTGIRAGARTPGAGTLDAGISNARTPDAGAALQTGIKKVSAKNQQQLWKERQFADLTVIGQFRGTYLICQDGDNLILIDQHAAHERIVFEKLSRNSGRIESQRLLIPETLELGFAEAQRLLQLIPRLDELGLEIEPFGGTTFSIKAVPVLLDRENLERLLTELLEKAADTGISNDPERLLDGCRMIMACHNAVRANQKLTQVHIQAMLCDLDQCENPYHCPHGRPVLVKWSRADLEKAFKRIV